MPTPLYCSWCGKSQAEVRKIIAGPNVFVCDECVELHVDMLAAEGFEPFTKITTMRLPEVRENSLAKTKAKRTASGRPIEEIVAGDAFRNSMLFRVDGTAPDGAPLWHGWVIMDAFLAGIDYARRQTGGAWVRNGTIVGKHTEIDLEHAETDTWITIKADHEKAEAMAARVLASLNK